MSKDSPNTSVFIEIIKENERLIYKVCSLYAQQEEDKKDLFQEIVVQAWTSYHRYRQDAKVSTWLYRVALNTAINYKRNNKKHKAVMDLKWLDETPAEQCSIYDEEYRLMYGMIEALPSLEKALVLLFLEDYSHKEIADILGLSVTNVSTKLMRVKDKLKKQAQQFVHNNL